MALPNSKGRPNCPLISKDSELTMELAHVQNENDNILWSFQWVKSPADETEGREIAKEEIVNKRADELAFCARDDTDNSTLTIQKKQIYSNAHVTFTVKNHVVCENFKEVITHAL